MPREAKPIEGVYEKNPRSGVWYARLRVNGKLVRKKVGTQRQAREYVEKARTIRSTGGGIVPQTAKRPAMTFAEIEKEGTHTTVGELCDEYLAHIRKPGDPARPRDQVNPPQRLAEIKKTFAPVGAGSVKPHQVKRGSKGLD